MRLVERGTDPKTKRIRVRCCCCGSLLAGTMFDLLESVSICGNVSYGYYCPVCDQLRSVTDRDIMPDVPEPTGVEQAGGKEEPGT